MMYKVVKHFTDLLDDCHKYNVGDIYPRDGYKPSAGRIKELSSENNNLAEVLIVAEPQTASADVREDAEKPKRKRTPKE